MKILSRIRFLCTLFAFLAFVVDNASAQDAVISYQGQLRGNGGLLTGEVEMEFSLWSDGSSSAPSALVAGPIAALTGAMVAVENGVFVVEIDFGAAAFVGASPGSRYLEVTVESGPPLSPRTRIDTVPFAIQADSSDFSILSAGVLPDAITSAMLVNNTVDSVDVKDGSIGSGDVNPQQVQRRIIGTCAAGSYVTGINEDGSVACSLLTVTLRGFDAHTILPTLTAGAGPAFVFTPDKCKTAAYMASEGETAVVSIDTSFLPTAVVGAIIFMNVGVSTNGSAFVFDNMTQSMDNLSDGIAHSTASKQVPLVAGSTYVFGPAIQLSAGTVNIQRSSCHGSVVIVRT